MVCILLFGEEIVTCLWILKEFIRSVPFSLLLFVYVILNNGRGGSMAQKRGNYLNHTSTIVGEVVCYGKRKPSDVNI